MKINIADDLDFIKIKPNDKLLTSDSEKILGRIGRKELDINFKYHNLRHIHASKLAEMNVPTVVVKARLGHSKIETILKYYTHITEGMRSNLVNMLNAV
jgi:integrase